MSETAGAENVIPQGDQGDPGVQGTPADNPAWTDFLSAFPQGMHDSIKPHLAKWDQGVNARIEQVHSEYAAWKPFRDQGITPEILQQGLSIYNAVNDDPRKVYDLLGQTFGYANAAQMMQQAGQGQQVPQQLQPEPTAEYQFGQQQAQLPPDPNLARLESMVELQGNILLAQRNAEIERQQEQLLDKELADLKGKIGEYDETFVLSYMQAGMSAEQAGAKWQEFRNGVLTQANRPAAPTTISGAGPLPSNAIDPSKLGTSDTRKLVADMMRATNQQK